MIDREKVIKHLKAYVDCYGNRHSMCEPDCVLYGHGDCAKYVIEYISDALELLKEREPKTVLYRDDGDYCPWCSTISTRTMEVQRLHRGTRYCPYCGQGVKWDADN